MSNNYQPIMFKRRRVSTGLLHSIYEREWSHICKYLNEASILNRFKAHALHSACDDPTIPINILKDIYYAYPEAAFIKDDDQHTPLKIAVDAGFEEAVEFLINTCPEDVVNCGSYLRSAVHSLNCTKMIDSFIHAIPEAAFISDDNGDSAFDLFFRIWNVPMSILLQTSQISDDIFDNEIGQGNWKIRDLYQKVCLFLTAANHHKNGKKHDASYLLHIALREKSCNWAFCKLLMALHPEQILKRDIDGNFPIHIIVAARNLSDEDSFLCVDCYENKSNLKHIEFLNGDTDYCCEECLEFKSGEITKKILNVRPGT